MASALVSCTVARPVAQAAAGRPARTVAVAALPKQQASRRVWPAFWGCAVGDAAGRVDKCECRQLAAGWGGGGGGAAGPALLLG